MSSLEWDCAVCTNSNRASDQSCSTCFARRDTVAGAPPESFWHCSACTAQNPAGSQTCSACFAPRATTTVSGQVPPPPEEDTPVPAPQYVPAPQHVPAPQYVPEPVHAPKTVDYPSEDAPPAQFVAVPAPMPTEQRCGSTQEDLMQLSRLDPSANCPLCEQLGSLCRVSSHKSLSVAVAVPAPMQTGGYQALVDAPETKHETKRARPEEISRAESLVRKISLDEPERRDSQQVKTTRKQQSTFDRYRFQCWALTYKNAILMIRNWKSSLVILITPAIFVLIIGLVALSEQGEESGTRFPTDLICLGPSCSTESLITPCVVFDNRVGQYGYGGLIPDAKCTSILFAPSDNPEVVSIMTELAQRNNLGGTPATGKVATTPFTDILASGQVVGMKTAQDFTEWFKTVGNTGWVMYGVVFETGNSTTSTLPNDVEYEIWYNQSATLGDFGGSWIGNAGLDKFSVSTFHSSVSLKMQRAVNEAIINVRGKARNGTSFNMPIDLNLRPFPDYPYRSPVDPPTSVVNFGSLLYFLAMVCIFLFAMAEIVGEKEKSIVLMMRTVGLFESVFWLSWMLYFCVLILFSVILLLIVGYCFGSSVPFFYSTDFRCLFVMFYMYGVSLMAFGFFWASLLSNLTKAIWAGLWWTVIGLLLQIVFLPFFGPVVQLIHDPYAMPRWALTLCQFYPPIGFGLAIEEVQTATTKRLDLDPVTGNIVEVLTSFHWADFVGEPGTLIAGTNLTSLICDSNIQTCEPFTKIPPVQFVNFQIFIFFFWTFLAWYISQAQATGNPLFIFTPSFWLSSKVYKVKAKPTRDGQSSQDSDVQEEYKACREGKNKESGVCVVNLEKIYGQTCGSGGSGKKAVDGLCVSMERNKVFCLLGHNGAGKTTSLNMICGKISVSAGDAFVCGFSINQELDQIRRIIGNCPQHDVLWPQLTALEHLRIASLFKGQSPTEAKKPIDDVLEAVKLHDVKDKQAGQYSGGMKRRLSVALSAMGDPEVIFMDEPTTGMDPMNRKHVWDAIQGLKKGRVIVLTTHSMEEADALGDRIGIMSAGKLEAIGTALHLKNKYGSGYLVKLVTQQSAQVQGVVKQIMPNANLLDDSAGSLTFSVPSTALVAMPSLFRWIEDNVEQKTGLLIDWAVSNTTLEEVFIRLAREEVKDKSHHKKGDKDKTSKNEALKEPMLEKPVEVAQDRAEKYNSDMNDPKGYGFSGLFLQRVALQRRQIKTNICLGCCPATAILLLLLASWALDLIPANFFRRQAIDAAADKYICQSCQAAALPVCRACALSDQSTSGQCVTNSFVKPGPVQYDGYTNPSPLQEWNFQVFQMCGVCTTCNTSNPFQQINLNNTQYACNDTQAVAICSQVQSMCTCNGTAYDDAVSSACASASYTGFWTGFANLNPQDQCANYFKAVNQELILDDPYIIHGFHKKIESIYDNSNNNYFDDQGSSTGVVIGVVPGPGVNPAIVGAAAGGKLQGVYASRAYQQIASPNNNGGNNGAEPYPPPQRIGVNDPVLENSLEIQYGFLSRAGVAGLMGQEIIQTEASKVQPGKNCPVVYTYQGQAYTDCWTAWQQFQNDQGFNTYLNASQYQALFFGSNPPIIMPPQVSFPPFANVSSNQSLDFGVTYGIYAHFPLPESPCNVYNNPDWTWIPRPFSGNQGGVQTYQCSDPTCGNRVNSYCLSSNCTGAAESTCRPYNNVTDCILTITQRSTMTYYVSPDFVALPNEQQLSDNVWFSQFNTSLGTFHQFSKFEKLEASETVSLRFPAGGIVFNKLGPGGVQATLHAFYTPVNDYTSKYGLVRAPINRTAPKPSVDIYPPACASPSPIWDPYPNNGGGGGGGNSNQRPQEVYQQLGVYPAFARLRLGSSRVMSEVSPAHVLLHYVSQGVLRYFVDPTMSITTKLRPQPYLNTEASAILLLADVGKSVLSELLVGFASSILLAPLMLPIVVEKERKLRAMMKMMGLRMSTYWAITYLWSMFFSMCVLIYMLIVAALTGLYPGGNILSRSAGGLIILLLLLWAHSQATLAIFISSFFARARCVSIFGFLSLILLVVLSLVLNQVVFAAADWEGDPSPWYLMLLAPMAFFRCLNLLAKRAYTWDSLGGSELGRNMGYLVLDSLIYSVLAWYLEQVLPQEFGVNRHPLFPIYDTIAWIKRIRKGHDEAAPADVELDVMKDKSTTDKSDDGTNALVVQEDEDVVAERTRLLKGDFPPDSPVQLVQLRKVYPGGFVAVQSVTLHIENGECFGLLGPNGAGKTTTISMLTGLFAMSHGKARLCGLDLATDLSRIYRLMGVCPQFDICWPDLSIEDHLLFYSRVKGVKKSQQKAMVKQIAKDVGLEAHVKKLSRELSGGMQRRLSLAISLIGNPRIVFLDEPTTGLDPETKRNIWALIDSLKAGRCIILTTHSMDEADALCGRIGIMSHGLLRCLGTNFHLKNRYGNGYKIDIRFKVGCRKRAQGFVTSLIPKAKLESSFGESSTFQVHKDDVKLSVVFAALLNRPEEVGIVDYGVRQTSLEEVFLKIARESEAAFQSKQ